MSKILDNSFVCMRRKLYGRLRKKILVDAKNGCRIIRLKTDLCEMVMNWLRSDVNGFTPHCLRKEDLRGNFRKHEDVWVELWYPKKRKGTYILIDLSKARLSRRKNLCTKARALYRRAGNYALRKLKLKLKTMDTSTTLRYSEKWMVNDAIAYLRKCGDRVTFTPHLDTNYISISMNISSRDAHLPTFSRGCTRGTRKRRQRRAGL